jgi:hypothetical protein
MTLYEAHRVPARLVARSRGIGDAGCEKRFGWGDLEKRFSESGFGGNVP